MKRVQVVILICVLAASGAAAQTVTGGSVRGFIKDEQSAALPGVTVSATSPSSPVVYTAISDAEGFYRLENLPPGDYTVSAELQGFARFVRGNIIARAGLTLSVDIVMKVGDLSETV